MASTWIHLFCLDFYFSMAHLSFANLWPFFFQFNALSQRASLTGLEQGETTMRCNGCWLAWSCSNIDNEIKFLIIFFFHNNVRISNIPCGMQGHNYVRAFDSVSKVDLITSCVRNPNLSPSQSFHRTIRGNCPSSQMWVHIRCEKGKKK